MANWGIGIGSFADGFARGLQMRKLYDSARKEDAAEKAREEAVEFAKQQRESQLEEETNRIMGLGPHEPQAPGPLQAEPVAVAQPVNMSNPQTVAKPQVKGMIQSGNIDLTKRPVVKNQDGTISTVRSMSFNEDGKEILVPTVSDDGRILSEQEAIENYRRTGKHLGIFDSPEAATSYAQWLHNQQDAAYSKQPAPGNEASHPVAASGISDQRMTREQARKLAEERLGDPSDSMHQIIAQRMRDYYVKAGDLDMAEKWDRYAETREARRQMRHFGNALKAASVGNHEGFIKNIRPVLEDNYGKGFEIRNTTPVKTKDGTVTGYNFEILNTRTGEVTQNSMSIDDLYQVGLTMGSPEQGFNRWLASQQQREEARSKAAAEAGKIQMQTAKEIAVEREKSRLRDQEIGPLGKKIRDMRVAGIPDDVIQRVVTSETISDAYKKGASPQEAKRLIVQEMMGKYVDFRGNPTKTPQEISAMADEVVKSIYGDEAAQPAAPSPQEAAASPGPAARGLPILDQKTGKLIYR